jgi:predicted TIM-barrel fold metal-dependent hydrolase
MMPLEEAPAVQREWGNRVLFIAVPSWQQQVDDPMGDWLRRIEAFYNLGSRIVKFHFAPESMRRRGWRFDSPQVDHVIREAVGRGMGIMTHMGDPDSWYAGKYADASVYGTREDHYRQWETVMSRWPAVPWVGAHMGGHPEDLVHLQRLLDAHPNLRLDCSATKWVSRSLSAHRDQARAFFIRNQDRILFGSDQVSWDDRGFDFLASRFWVQRTMWETDFVGLSPIRDADSPGGLTTLHGLALPTEVLQKLYHDNAVNYLRAVGVRTDWLE